MKMHKNIILTYGLFLGWLISFPFNGPVLKMLAAANNVSATNYGLVYTAAPALFLLVYAFFIVKDDVVEARISRRMLFFALIVLLGSILLFTVSTDYWYYIVAILGIVTVLYIVHWSWYYTLAVEIKTKLQVMGLVIIIGNSIYYLVNILVNHQQYVVVKILMVLILLNCLYFTSKLKLQKSILIKLSDANFPSKLMLVMCVYFFLLKINSGLTVQVLDPVFDSLYRINYELYVMLPYILAVALVILFARKTPQLFPVYLGATLLGIAYLAFVIIASNTLGYFITETFLQAGWGLLDVFIWTMFGWIASVYGRPLQICSIAFMANLLAGFIGSALGIYIVNSIENYELLAMAFALVMIFLTFLIIPWVMQTMEDDVFKYNDTDINNIEKQYIVLNNEYASIKQDNVELPTKDWVMSLATEKLTAREQEVLDLIIQGLANKDMAAALQIADNTIKTHIRRICNKLAVSNKKELLKKIHEERLKDN